MRGAPDAGYSCGLGLAIVDEIARSSGAVFELANGAGGVGLRASLRFAATKAPDHSVQREASGATAPHRDSDRRPEDQEAPLASRS